MTGYLCTAFRALAMTSQTPRNINLIKSSRTLLLLNGSGQFQFTRTKMVRAIRGGGRPVPYGVIKPEACKYKFKVIWPEDGQYTTKPLKTIKLGGRDPETGRVAVETLGGGHKQRYRWVKSHLYAEADKPIREKVQQVRYCPIRSAHIALTQTGEETRWIIASANMKKGDIITTYGDIPRIPVQPQEGDSHPVGALPIGTNIFNIEKFPGEGGALCKAAATKAVITRKLPNGQCLVRLPSKLDISINEKCMVTVGQASNIEKAGAPIGSPNRLRWLGFRPRSGLWHRKDGYCGRKIKWPKPTKVYPPTKPPANEPFILNL